MNVAYLLGLRQGRTAEDLYLRRAQALTRGGKSLGDPPCAQSLDRQFKRWCPYSKEDDMGNIYDNTLLVLVSLCKSSELCVNYN